MRHVSRRDFLLGAAGSAVLGLPGAAALAQSPDRFDLVIKGGEVLDPGRKLRARRDIGIRNAVIAALEPDIPDARAKQLLDARGKLVLPGLIDMHAHVYPQVSALGLPADELVPYTATTTYVSAGDAGANTFSALKHYIAAQARSRIYAFVHISSIGLSGFPVGEMLNIDYADVDLAAKTLVENPELVLGIKVRETVEVVGANGLEPLKRAILACERSGVRGARVMCHIGNAPGELSALLDLLRPGDILTHAYSGAGNNTVRDGKVLAAAIAAKKRGVVIDVGHGGGSFDYTVAEPAIQQGFTPDTIGSDIHAVSGNTPGMPYLPWVMSKFLNLGFSLEQVVAMATSAPAKIIGRLDKLGTLAVGAPADVSILELVEGPVDFVDTRKNARKGNRHLKPVATVRAGRPFGRPSLARRERLAQEKETEQGRHDETHLRDRDHHARLRALHALDHESEGEGENDRGPRRVAQRGAGRPDSGVDRAGERGGERDHHDALRGDHRRGVRARLQSELVDEVADADGRGGDQHARERRPALAPPGRVPGSRCAEQQPDRGERERDARDLVPRERFAEQQDRERRGEDEAQAENRRVDADRAGSQAVREIVEAD